MCLKLTFTSLTSLCMKYWQLILFYVWDFKLGYIYILSFSGLRLVWGSPTYRSQTASGDLKQTQVYLVSPRHKSSCIILDLTYSNQLYFVVTSSQSGWHVIIDDVTNTTTCWNHCITDLASQAASLCYNFTPWSRNFEIVRSVQAILSPIHTTQPSYLLRTILQ